MPKEEKKNFTKEELLEKLYKSTDNLEEDWVDDIVDGGVRIPTISPSVNWALQGGIVPGRFYCFVGPESAGKSMFAVGCCAKLLKENPDGIILWFDTEGSYTKHWARLYLKTEEDVNRIHRVKAKFGRDIFDYFTNEALKLHDQGLKVVGCVVDSIQGITPPVEEANESVEDQNMAALARFLPGAVKSVIKSSRDRKIPWIFTSQVREVFDSFEQRMGKPWDMTGGKAFLHYIDALVLFEPLQGNSNKLFDESKTGMDDKPIQIGSHVQVKIWGKCRVGVPNRVAAYKYLYKKGIINTYEEIAHLALNLGIVKLEGKTYSFGEEKLGVGFEDYCDKVKDDKEFRKMLYDRILKDE